MNSILQDKKECFFCGAQTGLHRHHVFYGTANRKMSEKHGLTVWLCHTHHNGSDQSVHFSKSMDNALKIYAQRMFEFEHSSKEFRKDFGKSWL